MHEILNLYLTSKGHFQEQFIAYKWSIFNKHNIMKDLMRHVTNDINIEEAL
jgi:hypothetical protein